MAFILMLFIVITGVHAQAEKVKDHGVWGTLFEIAEEDMIEVLKKRLSQLQQSGKLADMETAFKAKAQAKLETPDPVPDLKITTEERSFTHDPTLVMAADVKDHEGRVLLQQGQRVNPLHFLQPSQGLLFIDGNHEGQKQWAKDHADQFIIVLVNGKPLSVEQDLKRPIYFDQGGVLCQHYRIQHIPARIEVAGEVLQITEFKVTP